MIYVSLCGVHLQGEFDEFSGILKIQNVKFHDFKKLRQKTRTIKDFPWLLSQ